MQMLQSLFIWLHVLAGFIGLTAFWIPVFTRKGGKNHRLYGKIFKYSAYTLLAAAAIALIIRTPEFVATDFSNENEVMFLSFYLFITYLLLVVYIGLRHGFLVLEHKRDITELDNGLNNTLAYVSMAASVMLIAYAIIVSPGNQLLLYALSPIGVASGLDIKTAIRNKHNYKKTWLYEHLGALLGTGIAFHTAFAVFGAGQLFNLNLSGSVQVLPWIAPVLIGMPAIMIWTRIYKQRYGDLNRTAALNES
ncbi:MAG: hypothetical protein COA71_13545 [SAR86 cluster bacterium]|uniref:DUF2306 domain-containing protein n=1 Tax=SAR86 cluster bacterium TaxID=2030880 RepID=A0A2A5C863_9GAMM|nr:MAG: hypothetical protein COA71_13545 [SAR86 cluster bacterium]